MGWRVKVLAPHKKGAKEHENMDGVEVFRYRYMNQNNETIAYGGGIPANLKAEPSRWLWVPGFFASGLYSASKLIRDVDIVHAHWSFAGLMAYGATRFVHKPYIVTFHGSDIMGAKGAMLKVAKIAAKNAAAVITHSHAMKNAVLEFTSSEKVVLLNHGIDVDVLSKARAGENPQIKKIIAAGRLSVEKGVDVLIEALALLKKREDWVCVIVGKGPERKSLEALATERGVLNKVRFAGQLPHDELARLLAESHIAVAPSRREGFGIACAEMAASGLPVVATRCGGLEDIVTDNRGGVLVDTENPHALSQGLALLLDNPEKREEMGVAGRRKIRENFSTKKAAEQLVKLYSSFFS